MDHLESQREPAHEAAVDETGNGMFSVLIIQRIENRERHFGFFLLETVSRPHDQEVMAPNSRTLLDDSKWTEGLDPGNGIRGGAIVMEPDLSAEAVLPLPSQSDIDLM